MPAIFISYRREDSIAYSGRLYDRLTAEFGKGQVFMDIDSIDPGADFIEVIEQTVAACDAVLVVIGKQWLTVADAQGRRMLRRRETGASGDDYGRIPDGANAGDPRGVPARNGKEPDPFQGIEASGRERELG